MLFFPLESVLFLVQVPALWAVFSKGSSEALRSPQASYNLTGVGLSPANATTRKRIQTALRKALGSGVNATLLEVGTQGAAPTDSSSAAADASSADASSADAAPAASPDASIAGVHFHFCVAF